MAARAREGLDADRIAQERQLAQQRRDGAKFRRELAQARRSFQTDTFSAPFGETTTVGAPANATVVGAPVAQAGIDEFGVQDGTDLTVGFNRGRAFTKQLHVCPCTCVICMPGTAVHRLNFTVPHDYAYAITHVCPSISP